MFPLQDSNRSRSVPVVTYLLLILNSVFFLIELSMPENLLNLFVDAYGFVPSRFLSEFGTAEIFTIFSSMFLHGGWMHLISNMWALHVFGDNVEDRLGHFSYLLFYLICGIFAALAELIFTPDSVLPTVGASGAIAGILGAYLILFPKSKIITWIPIFFLPYFIELPAFIFLGIWFFSQFFSGLGAIDASPIAAESTIAWWAHVGGFLAGLALVKIFEKRQTYREFFPDEYYPW